MKSKVELWRVEDGKTVEVESEWMADKFANGVNEGLEGAGVLLRTKSVGIEVDLRKFGNW